MLVQVDGALPRGVTAKDLILEIMLSIVLDRYTVDALFEATAKTPGYRLRIDLNAEMITTPQARVLKFSVDHFRKSSLLNGLDEIDLTLSDAGAIHAYEAQRRLAEPWLFGAESG